MATQTETSILREAPELEAVKFQLLKDAAAFAGQPVTLPEAQIADFSGLQQAAFQKAQQDFAAGKGIGSYLDLLTAGQTGIGTGLQTLTQALPGLDLADAAALQSLGQYRPDDISAYLDPFQEEVIDETLAELQRRADIQQQDLAQAGVKAGAFGGTRYGIQEAELGRNLAQAQAQALAQLRSQNYGQALASSQAAFEAAKGREAGLAGLLASSTGQRMAGGAQQAALAGQQIGAASTGQQLSLQDLATLQGLGGQQQLLQQAVLDAQRQNIAAQQQEEAGRLGFLSDIYKGAPSSQMTLASQSVAPPVPSSMFQQIAGVGTGILGSAAAANKLGLFN